ncbi:hypothetical protein ACQEUU_37035 [Nonomuraea sp. CA-218870]|uniref:hypothetical protein n=1 Tax=Nonomuraea sp. CA-218870 TaxID=3239998 RepID=UPI003D91DB3C
MPEPLTPEQPIELPSHDELDELVDTDPIRLRDVAFELRAEVERLRRELSDLEGQNALTESHFSSHVAETIIEQDALKKRAEKAEAELAALREKAETRLAELAEAEHAYRKVGNKAGAARQDYAAGEIRALFGIEWKPGGGEPGD